MLHSYRPQTKFAKVMFLQVSVILSTGRGACVVAPGGVHGCSGGACVVAPGERAWLLGGHAWLLWGVCVVAPGGHVWLLGGHAWLLWGACMVAQGACMVALGGAWLLWGACVVAPGGYAWLLREACIIALGGHAWFFWRGECVVFSMRYGQWAGSTHPTGMHSCWCLFTSNLKKIPDTL